MSRVFVLGAGASHGESLIALDDSGKWTAVYNRAGDERIIQTPPLIEDFFADDYLPLKREIVEQTQDFYTEWIFRKALEYENGSDMKIWIVNPLNDATALDDPVSREAALAFKQRMNSIFHFGYDDSHCTFSQIEEILGRV